MKDVRTPKNKCPHCGYKVDAATGVLGAEGHTPKEGDISVCLCCGKVSAFNADLTVRKATKEEEESFNRDIRVIQTQMARSYVVGDEIKERIK